MKKQDLETSAPSLRRTLRGRDYFTLAFGSMVGDRRRQPDSALAEIDRGAVRDRRGIRINVLPWIPGSFRIYEFMALAGWIALGDLVGPPRMKRRDSPHSMEVNNETPDN
jgi:hypothetical protein